MNQDTSLQSSLGRKPSPLPPLSPQDPLSKDQWKILYAFADTIVPSVKPARLARQNVDLGLSDADYGMTVTKLTSYASASDNPALLDQYLSEKPSENIMFRENIYRLLSCYIPKDLFDQLTLGLTLLKCVLHLPIIQFEYSLA